MRTHFLMMRLQRVGIIADLTVSPDVLSEGRDPNLSTEQKADPELMEIVQYLTDGTLPAEEKRARAMSQDTESFFCLR